MSETVNSRLEHREFSSLSSLQRRLEDFDAARGWDAVPPAHTALHLMEELGEVMREALHLEGYKSPDPAARARLGGELADVTLLLFKLASQYGVELEHVVLEKMAANDVRFPLEESKAAMRVYAQQQGLEQQNLEMQSAEMQSAEMQSAEMQSAEMQNLEQQSFERLNFEQPGLGRTDLEKQSLKQLGLEQSNLEQPSLEMHALERPE